MKITKTKEVVTEEIEVGAGTYYFKCDNDSYNKMVLEEDEGEGYIASFEGIDLIAAEGTKEDTIEDLKEQLIEYAEEVIEDLHFYARDSERMKKFPHLLKVWLFPDNLDTIIKSK